MDAIQAARAKAAKRWSSLEDQTVPLFDKMANGQAAKSDIEKLKQLYAAQSNVASKAFDKSIKAAKDSAKESVKSTIKEATKKHQMFSTSELRRLLEVAISIALEKSAYIIKEAVDLALEDHMDLLDDLIRDVRRMQVKTDEMLFKIKNNSISGMVAKAMQEQAESKKGFIRRLLDKGKDEKDVIHDSILAMADIVSAKIASVIASVNKAKKNTKYLYKGIAKTASEYVDTSDDLFAKAVRKMKESQNTGFFSRIFGRSDDSFDSRGRSLTDIVRHLIEVGEEEEKSQYTVHTGEDVDSYEKLDEYMHGYKKLDEDYQDEELIKAKRQEATLSERAMAAILNSRLLNNRLFKKYDERFLKMAEDNFANTLKEQRVDYDIEEIKDKLEELKNARNEDGSFSIKAYLRYRAVAYRDLKRVWLKQAKDKAAYINRRLKRYTRKTNKFLKWFGIAYVASVIINALNAIAPQWKTTVKDWLSEEGFNILVEASEKVGELIGTVVVKTLKWIWDHKSEIAQIALGIAAGMTKSIVKAALSLVGLNYDDIFGGETIIDEAKRRSAIIKDEDIFEKFIYSDEGRKLQEEIKVYKPETIRYLLGANSDGIDENSPLYDKKQIVDQRFEEYKKNHPDAAAAIDETVNASNKSTYDTVKDFFGGEAKNTTSNVALDASKNVQQSSKTQHEQSQNTQATQNTQDASDASGYSSIIDGANNALKTLENKVKESVEKQSTTATPTFTKVNSGQAQQYDEAKLTNANYANAQPNQPAPFTPGTSDALSKGLEDARASNTEASKLAQTNTLEPSTVEQPALNKSASTQQNIASSGRAVSTESIQNFPQNDMMILNGGLI